MSLLVFLSGGHGVGKILYRDALTGIEFETFVFRPRRDLRRTDEFVVNRDLLGIRL